MLKLVWHSMYSRRCQSIANTRFTSIKCLAAEWQLLLLTVLAMGKVPQHLTELDLDGCFWRAGQASKCVTYLQTVHSTLNRLRPHRLSHYQTLHHQLQSFNALRTRSFGCQLESVLRCACFPSDQFFKLSQQDCPA